MVQLTGFGGAERAALQLVHGEGYVAGLQRVSDKCADSGTTVEVEWAPTYVTGTTSSDACLVRALGRDSSSPARAAGAPQFDAWALPVYCLQSAPLSCARAVQAAGAAIALVDHVVAASQQQHDPGAVPAGFAVCRPPGHHCLPREAMGFCIFGNVAVAARHAQKQHGLQRVRRGACGWGCMVGGEAASDATKLLQTCCCC